MNISCPSAQASSSEMNGSCTCGIEKLTSSICPLKFHFIYVFLLGYAGSVQNVTYCATMRGYCPWVLWLQGRAWSSKTVVIRFRPAALYVDSFLLLAFTLIDFNDCSHWLRSANANTPQSMLWGMRFVGPTIMTLRSSYISSTYWKWVLCYQNCIGACICFKTRNDCLDFF